MRRHRLVGLVLVALLGTSCVDGRPRVENAGPHPRRVDFSYVIPAGTGARIDRGERIDIVPSRLRARVGQIIRIENRDVRGQVVGPFYVNAGATMTQRFASPGRFVGQCTVHPSGNMELDVSA